MERVFQRRGQNNKSWWVLLKLNVKLPKNDGETGHDFSHEQKPNTNILFEVRLFTHVAHVRNTCMHIITHSTSTSSVVTLSWTFIGTHMARIHSYTQKHLPPHQRHYWSWRKRKKEAAVKLQEETGFILQPGPCRRAAREWQCVCVCVFEVTVEQVVLWC